MAKFELKKVDNLARWDEFVENSNEGTVFSLSDYLQGMGKNFQLFFVLQGMEIKAGVSLVLSDDGERVIDDDLVIYNGLMFDPMLGQKDVKAKFQKFEITEFVANELASKYKSVELALSPFFIDLRPFLWFNYNSEKPEDKFIPDLRYTSLLNISSFRDSDEDEELAIFRNIDTLRQRNLREGKKRGAKVELDFDVEAFMSFYIELLESQGENVSEEKRFRMRGLIDHLIRSGKAMGFTLINEEKEPIYKLLHCFDSKRAYYLFGAGDKSSKDRYKGTFAFWESFKYLAVERKMNEIDLEGINSPKRGWFKLSFGGTIQPYYKVKKSESVEAKIFP